MRLSKSLYLSAIRCVRLRQMAEGANAVFIQKPPPSGTIKIILDKKLPGRKKLPRRDETLTASFREKG